MKSQTTVLEAGGLHWATSESVIERTLLGVPGVLAVDASAVSQTATVTYDPNQTSVAQLVGWVNDCGYHCTGLDLVTAAAWHLLMGAAGLMVFAAAVEGLPVIAWTPRFVLSLAFLALVGTAATTVAWFAEARRSQARHVDGVDVPDSGPWYRVGLRRIGRVAGRMDRRRAPRRVGGHVDHPSTTAPGPHAPDGCRPRRLVSHTAGHMNNE